MNDSIALSTGETSNINPQTSNLSLLTSDLCLLSSVLFANGRSRRGDCFQGVPGLHAPGLTIEDQMVDHLFRMSLDLNTILKDWPHENRAIKVRKILGLDGRQKLQLRIDLGVLQMELTGRPDGMRPHGCESLLTYHQLRAARAKARNEDYELTPAQCAELQQEGIQYYHRYLSLFQINDFQGVIRDTQRNLDLFNFVAGHSGREDVIWSFQQFRPYVLMMNTRAKASILLGEGKFADAMREIERGRDVITEFFQQSSFPELATKSSELAFLEEWLEEVSSKRPLSKLEIMQREMEVAIASELYERAAELRDAIKLLQTQST